MESRLWSAKTLFLLAGTGGYQQNLTILHSKVEIAQNKAGASHAPTRTQMMAFWSAVTVLLLRPINRISIITDDALHKALHKALPILALLLSSQAFAQFTLTKNADNYKARKSTFQRWDGAATVQGQDTVYSTYRYCVNQGWHSVYIWANSADDSVDLMVQYQTVPDTVSPFIAKTIWTNIAALTDTLWIYPYPIYPVTSEFIRFRAYGGTDNDASTGSAFNLDDYGWNIE